MKVLVSGHLGFVGRHLLPALEQKNYAITGIDIKDGIDAREWFRTNDEHFDLVFHLAAIVGGRALIEGSPLSVAVDLSIDAEMFGWAVRTQPGRVVYFSSSAAYPIRYQYSNSGIRLRESDINLKEIATPDLTYGWSKLTGEMLAGHARSAGVPVTILRPFSGYGADQDLEYPFPSFLDRAFCQMDPFDIWGDGRQVRDWIHIDDIIKATMAIVEQGLDGPFNLGTGRATSFIELFEIMTEIAGYSPAVRFNPAAPTGVHYRVCDPTEMLKVYQPKIQLEDAIKEALSNVS